MRLPILLALAFSFLLVDYADAWPFRRRRRANYTYSTQSYTNTYIGGEDVQAAAYNRAASLAAKGYGHHFSLPCCGATGEGWGCGSTAEQAIASCCYWGRPVAAQAAVQSSNGLWYAIRLYY